MTTIAWDGKTIAADRRCGYHNMEVDKLVRTKRGVAGSSGQTNICAHIEKFFDDPPVTGDVKIEKDTYMLHVLNETTAEVYLQGSDGTPRIVRPPFAIGSGSDYAMGAMAMGASAAEAVEIAARFDYHTGNGVDVMVVSDGA